jgi:glycosyltransferase involved in cell wall biosynthesis
MRELRTARRVAAIARRACDDGAADVELLIERHALFSDASLRLSASTGVPWILEVNAPPVRERGLRGEAVWEPAGSRWEREILRAAPRIAVVSRWLADWLVCEIGCERERVAVVPNGVPPHVGDRQATREALGLRDDDFVLGFLGSFQPWHGTEALPFLLHALPDARLLLVGSAASGILPTTEALRVFGERVLTVGRVPEPEVAHLVAAMDVGLAPYPPDAPPWFCPLKVLAYRAQGTPVVGTAIADTPTLVDGGGDVVPPGDLDALADAVAVWRGRRCAPWIRAWTEVAGELLRLGLAGHTSAG